MRNPCSLHDQKAIERYLQPNITNIMIQISIFLINSCTIQNVVYAKCSALKVVGTGQLDIFS